MDKNMDFNNFGEFIDFCKSEKDFNTQKMVTILQDATVYRELLNDISFNIIAKDIIKTKAPNTFIFFTVSNSIYSTFCR